MRAESSQSFFNKSFIRNMYILFLFLSFFLTVVHARPQPVLNASQQGSQVLSVRSEPSSSPTSTSTSDSQSPTDSTSTTTTSITTTTTKSSPATTSKHHTTHNSPTPSQTSQSSPTTSTSTTSTLITSSSSSSDSSSSTSSLITSSASVTLIPAAVQSTLSVAPSDFQAPTTLDATNFGPDVTADVAGPNDTSLPSENTSSGSNNGGFIHNTGAVAGTFTAVGVVVAGLVIILVVTRLKKRSQNLNFGEEDEDYVVQDRSGRTGFTSVNYGNDSFTEMTERPHNDQSFTGDEVAHTLGQEIIQHAPFDPFHNNFAFVDNSYSSSHGVSQVHTHDPFGTAEEAQYAHGQYQDGLRDHGHDGVVTQQAPWVTHAVTGDTAIPFRYEQHPYANDAVHVTPLRRHPSERAEYGLAC